jgi:hypothetical protein
MQAGQCIHDCRHAKPRHATGYAKPKAKPKAKPSHIHKLSCLLESLRLIFDDGECYLSILVMFRYATLQSIVSGASAFL